jgi:hypothetical protein
MPVCVDRFLDKFALAINIPKRTGTMMANNAIARINSKNGLPRIPG